ncbi:hypothetical protein [Kurthia massiliensis]|uniref:hypothetical protein n=1 Tax=Kurthia massiliensis TaxID=1033739 RepID=UPI000288080A|nr:hypothetical protein [Kurthia massiliensis]
MKAIAVIYYVILAGYIVDFMMLVTGMTALGEDLTIPFTLLTLIGIIASCYLIQLFGAWFGIGIIIGIIALVLGIDTILQWLIEEPLFSHNFSSDFWLTSLLHKTSEVSIWLFIAAVSYALGLTNSRTLQPLIASFVAIVFYVLVVPIVYDTVTFTENNAKGLLYENVKVVTFVWLILAFVIDLILLQLQHFRRVYYSKSCTRRMLILFYGLMVLIISMCAISGLWLTSIVATILIVATLTLLLVKEDIA